MIKSPQGFPIQSPYLAIANRPSEIMMRIASEFGLTPASRSRISAPQPPTESLLERRLSKNRRLWRNFTV
jgi:phage terminase small subunit